MSTFDQLITSVTEKIKFKQPADLGSDSKISGFAPGEHGYDPENVENFKVIPGKHDSEFENEDQVSVSHELGSRIKDLILNFDEPGITETEEDIEEAIKELLKRIKK